MDKQLTVHQLVPVQHVPKRFLGVGSQMLCGTAGDVLLVGSRPFSLFFLVGTSLPSRLRLRPLSRPELSLLPRFPFGLRSGDRRHSYGATPGGHAPEFWRRCGTPGRGLLVVDTSGEWSFDCTPCFSSLVVLVWFVWFFWCECVCGQISPITHHFRWNLIFIVAMPCCPALGWGALVYILGLCPWATYFFLRMEIYWGDLFEVHGFRPPAFKYKTYKRCGPSL